MATATTTYKHPLSEYVRTDRMPHIWCPGCGIGTVMNAFVRAIHEDQRPTRNMTVVSGIGCSGRIAGYLRMDSFHTTHGRAIPLATGLKLARPELDVVVISGDGDLTAIGGNHFIHAARRNMDLAVICINNFNYGMTGGQTAPTTPLGARTPTSPGGNLDEPFSLPRLAAACGAVYVARWTVFHVRQLQKAISEVLARKGFRFLEVISPCPTLFGRRNRIGGGVNFLKQYRERSVVRHGADPNEVDLTLDSPIVVGRFVDIEKPTWLERHAAAPAKAG